MHQNPRKYVNILASRTVDFLWAPSTNLYLLGTELKRGSLFDNGAVMGLQGFGVRGPAPTTLDRQSPSMLRIIRWATSRTDMGFDRGHCNLASRILVHVLTAFK